MVVIGRGYAQIIECTVVSFIVLMIAELQCSLFEAPIEVLAHGCNCFNTMGAGLARSIAERFPEVEKEDSLTKSGDRKKLGTIAFVRVLDESSKIKYIVNMYTQFNYGCGERQINYEAMYRCLESLKSKNNPKMRIGLPFKIGCGLGGGDWNIVKAMIYSVFQKIPTQVYLCSRENELFYTIP